MHNVILSYSILACIVCNAQNITNGTELADNLTSRSRVVVDAFENASNRVHALIQEVSPAPDLSGYATTAQLGAVSNTTTSLDATKRGVTDLAVYSGYAPWNVPYFPEPAQWKPEIGYWEAKDLEWGDFWYFRWKSGVWEFYNSVYPSETLPDKQPDDVATNSEYALSVYFPNENFTITRTSIYATNGAHLVTSADPMPYLSTTGGVVTGNIILPQTGGSGGKTTINGNGITAGIEGFTIDSFSDPLVLKGSSATINFSDTRFIRGWDAVSDGNGNSIARLFSSTNDFVRNNNGTATNLTVENLFVQGNFSPTNGFIQYSIDGNNNRTALTIGSRANGYIGAGSVSIGERNISSGTGSFVCGSDSSAIGNSSFVVGTLNSANDSSFALGWNCYATNDLSFVWNWDDFNDYGSHGLGTFNISPFGGISGFYIGNTNLYDIITSVASGGSGGDTDSSYIRTIGITNINQSVQYVNITDTVPSILSIQLPTDGRTKDWIVYVQCVTNVSITLPSATWWMADAAYTNDVPSDIPTAFYFSQIADGIFYLGRQELVEVTAP